MGKRQINKNKGEKLPASQTGNDSDTSESSAEAAFIVKSKAKNKRDNSSSSSSSSSKRPPLPHQSSSSKAAAASSSASFSVHSSLSPAQLEILQVMQINNQHLAQTLAKEIVQAINHEDNNNPRATPPSANRAQRPPSPDDNAIKGQVHILLLHTRQILIPFSAG